MGRPAGPSRVVRSRWRLECRNGLLWPSATAPCHPKPGQSARMVRSAALACGGGARVAKANDGGRSHATLMLLQHEPRGIRRSQCTHGRNAHHGILSSHPAHMSWCGCFERTAQQTTTRHGGGGHRAQDGGNRRRGLRGTGNFRAVTSPGRVCADATARTPNWHRTPALAPSRTAVQIALHQSQAPSAPPLSLSDRQRARGRFRNAR